MTLRPDIPFNMAWGLLVYEWVHIPMAHAVGLRPLSTIEFAGTCIGLSIVAAALGAVLHRLLAKAPPAL